MSKIDEDGEERHKRRRSLLRRMLIPVILAMFAITYILLSSEVILNGSTAPVIDTVEYFREYRRGPGNTGGKVIVHVIIHYHDREGDISTLEIEHVQTESNMGMVYSANEKARPSVQRNGAVRTIPFECTAHGFYLTLNLIDKLGNRSNTIDELVECFVPELIPTVQFQATGTASAKSQE
jgi:hypothetical protein